MVFVVILLSINLPLVYKSNNNVQNVTIQVILNKNRFPKKEIASICDND